ncbi:MAG: hypothetical protein KIT87_21450 [Anaerolineae bacterium]|nr:hypothetical protein [Anaerolineae bacterium]
MPDKPSVVQTFTSEEGVVYQLLYLAGSASPWRLVIDGEMDSTYDDYGDALRAWEEVMREA